MENCTSQSCSPLIEFYIFQMFGAKLSFPPGSQDNLWFYYLNGNRTFMIDGQGVASEVTEPDIGATNGVIHVIDRVLGNVH